uniref:Uncharacterized protein n=1 Tax=Rhizophora mucronata TaxID=61149 RepID=A0A2P2PCW2_RHIMU
MFTQIILKHSPKIMKCSTSYKSNPILMPNRFNLPNPDMCKN